MTQTKIGGYLESLESRASERFLAQQRKRKYDMSVYDAAFSFINAIENRWALDHPDGERASATAEGIASQIDVILPDLRAAVHKVYPHLCVDDEDTEIVTKR